MGESLSSIYRKQPIIISIEMVTGPPYRGNVSCTLYHWHFNIQAEEEKREEIADQGYTEPGNSAFLELENICSCLSVLCRPEILQYFSLENSVEKFQEGNSHETSKIM